MNAHRHHLEDKLLCPTTNVPQAWAGAKPGTGIILLDVDATYTVNFRAVVTILNKGILVWKTVVGIYSAW